MFTCLGYRTRDCCNSPVLINPSPKGHIVLVAFLAETMKCVGIPHAKLIGRFHLNFSDIFTTKGSKGDYILGVSGNDCIFAVLGLKIYQC